jgi:cytochrome c-type biogenesis protein CcmF
VTTGYGLYARVAGRGGRWHWASTPRAFYGMTLAHFGMGMFIVGVTMTTAYSVEKDVRVVPGDVYELAGLQFYFDGVDAVRGPNYTAQRGSVRVVDDGRPIASLATEKRTYSVQGNPMTEAGIDAGFTRDLYVSLGEPLGADGAWALRIYYKPFIRWIWLGGLLMALGGVLAATDRRYRLSRRRATVAANAIAATA